MSLDLKIFLGLGIIGFVALVITSLAFGYLVMEGARMQKCQGRSTLDKGCQPSSVWEELRRFDNSDPRLGEQKSICGGPERFPCRPGLECRRQGEEEYGACE